MAFDEFLAARVREVISRRRGFEEKKMFGGIGFLLNGNMCVGVWKKFLILRLGLPAAEQALQQPHVREFDITGKAMRGWVMLEPRGIEDERILKERIDQAISFVRKLPVKK